ncbi:NAD(P)H-quinone oxidoreductase [Saccharophagus sp. K07]|jgi:NADPH2:quinone reductase|uniref:NAD(P)H-quinone oxidoreductase n=1 Tax=Saccharophagus sp. K07 TaxID=2283636 RepID=UPI00351C46AC
MMRFIDIERPGGPEVLQLKRGALPTFEQDEVLIQVAAIGVNRPDIMQRQGRYPAPEGASPILGLEVAGVVAAVGRDAGPWRVGQRVCALTNGGGYAEFVSVPAKQCMAVPEALDFVVAAALPEALFTVWSNVYDRGALGVGETLLIHGGSSGIGTIAIQMARITGARVYATAGSEAKCRVCEKLGALRGINYKEEDFVEVMKQITGGRGADVILDMVGGSYIQRNIQAAAKDGRIVNIAFQEGAVAEVNFMPVMMKRLTLTGSTLRARSKDEKASIARHVSRKIWPAVLAERIKPIIHKVFPLEDVALAHKELEAGNVIGKIVLVTDKYGVF